MLSHVFLLLLYLLQIRNALSGIGSSDCPIRPLSASGVWKQVKSPANFPPTFYCKMIIVPRSKNKQIELEFSNFKMADTPSCEKQKMELYDGKVSEQTLMSRFCGNHRPHRITTTQKRIVVVIVSKLAMHESWMGRESMYEFQYRENVGWDEFKANQKLDPGQKPQPLQPKKPGGTLRTAGVKGTGGKGYGTTKEDGKYVISGPPQKKYPQNIKNRAKQAESRVYVFGLSLGLIFSRV